MFNSGFLSRIASDRTGNVLAIAAAAMVPFTIMVGSALDLSVTYMARGKLQNACDAASLAARQSMVGINFSKDVEAEGDKFFDFNFPEGTAGAEKISFELTQNTNNKSQLDGVASAEVPTSLINVIGIDHLDISVKCDAVRDMGHNDVMLVLDVTGSMNCAPGQDPKTTDCALTEQPGSKLQRLRDGAMGLFRALQSGDGSMLRVGMVPYSHTVNVGRSLMDNDILKDQKYVDGSWTYTRCDTNGVYIWNCQNLTSQTKPQAGFTNGGSKYNYNLAFNKVGEKIVNISDSLWNATTGLYPGNRQGFRTSGIACIEERPTIDSSNPAPSGQFIIRHYVTRDDIDASPKNDNDSARQFGRYDPSVQEGYTQDGCPAEATRLTEYAKESDFKDAIDKAAAKGVGGTYHDVGMLWGTRFISRTGFFKGNNPKAGFNSASYLGYPVNTHIVFMTDGIIDTDKVDGSNDLYSAHGLERYQDRTRGTETENKLLHLARFKSVCNQARQMGITVWVIALDVGNTDDIKSCATSDENFYTSDGSDLYDVFVDIGRGIGNLRLTR